MDVGHGRDATWVVATRNAGKLRELRSLLAGAGIRAIDLDVAGIPESVAEDELESFETFEENALAKARWFAERAGGPPVLADDSGLEVRALGGEPGVRSKRWSGRVDLSGAELDASNNALLLGRLRGVEDRRASFVCAVAWRAAGREIVVRGELSGTILERGVGTHGFGYDPLFFATELGMTLGEAPLDAKERVSHRARAIAELLAVHRARTL